ncbi:hypothetical protein C8K30_110259 [Promicromonospora sp. AC04]|uniref:DUF2264 domain-containing protein n=1 Tax=Promicromonospora sp. AC04 TaxID=2135723 RepID=UPI000D492EB7|nr:DUF2264 domain-containing protein [Promicromonospora sp. AC04]PUB24114.1 hypothetical protein C8K30_110259 [Promicromonospora sp. AC04]
MTSTDAAAHATLRPAQRWTRDHWLSTADRLLDATADHASPGRALVRLPGPVSASGAWSDGLEGYARTFLLAAFRVRGENGGDPAGLLERYAEGLRHGTDPADAERWPRIDERRQAVVEAASVAVALSETRQWLWDRLDDGTRERTVDWLAGIVGTAGYRNNWIWFQNVVEEFLASVGGPWDQADLDRNDELQERLYVGDGWYSDGHGRDGRRQSFDWYAGWAWHFYPVLHARIQGRPLPERHAGRLRAYLDQAQHLVGATGAPLLQGRSATYRLGLLAPFWAGALTGATPLAPGQTRALTAAVAEHFTASGSIDERGLLPVGWHRRYDRIRQLYTGAASPYWASKGFLGLLLPPDHAVWTADPEPPTAWRDTAVVPLRAPGWLVSATPEDGLVRIVNHGSDRLLEHAAEPRADDPFYRRAAYANLVSPQLSQDAIAAPVESHVALLDADGVPSHRDGVDRLALGDHVAASWSRVHWLGLPGSSADGAAATWASMRRGPRLVTASVVRGRFEVRIAWYLADALDGRLGGPAGPGIGDGDGVGTSDDGAAAWPCDVGPWRLQIGGWALAAPDEHDLTVETGDDWVRVVRRDGLSSLVRGLTGLTLPGTRRRDGADPLGAASDTPLLRSSGALAPGEAGAALVVLSGAPSPLDLGAVESVTRLPDADRTRVAVRWRDGQVDVVDGPTGPVP